MKNIFTLTPPAQVDKSVFDLSHERKLTCSMGKLIPILVQETLPGDKFTIDSQHLVRFMPLLAPIMHRVNVYTHYFYVPNRILWDHWEKFITGDEVTTAPAKSLHDLVLLEGCLGDYMGLPTGDMTNASEYVNMLPFYAYARIYNEFYRDENLCDEIKIDGTDDETLIEGDPLTRAWEKDYFTSCLPFAQKGDPVTLAGSVTYKTVASVIPDNETGNLGAVAGGHIQAGTNDVGIDNVDEIAINIEDLRYATRVQRFLERLARAGSRYSEYLLGVWGVLSEDARLDKPEYIGGGKAPVVISEVLNTTGWEDSMIGDQGYPAMGEMFGHGISVGNTNRAEKYCTDHGWIIGILSIMPNTGYQQGIPKMFSRRYQLDYYIPDFAQLGEQEVLNKEIYYAPLSIVNNGLFGYQSRYAEYKFAPSTVHGEFRNGLEHWHLGRIFDTLPELTDEFVNCVPTTRVFPELDQKTQCYVQVYNRITASRPMPYYNDPQL